MRFWFVAVPLAVVWLLALADIQGHSGTRRSKIAWSISVTLAWPAIIGWYLLRPTPGRLAQAADRIERRRQAAVDAVLARSSGRLSRDDFRVRLSALSRDAGDDGLWPTRG